MNTTRAVLFLAGAMMMTGTNVPIGKVVVETLPVYVFAVLRFFTASAVLAVIDRGVPGPRLRDLDPRDWRDLGLTAFFGMVLYTIFILEGVKRTSSTDAGIILASLPAVIAVLGALVYGERLRPIQGLCVLFAATGVGLILTGGSGAGTTQASSLPGDLFVGGAVMSEAIFAVASRRIAQRLSPLRLALGASLLSAVFSLPLLLFVDIAGAIAKVPATTWLLAGWYTLTASVLSLLLWYRAVPHVPTWLAGICTTALPLSALAVAVLVLGEPLRLPQVIGAALVILATITASLGARRT